MARRKAVLDIVECLVVDVRFEDFVNFFPHGYWTTGSLCYDGARLEEVCGGQETE